MCWKTKVSPPPLEALVGEKGQEGVSSLGALPAATTAEPFANGNLKGTGKQTFFPNTFQHISG